MKVIVFVAKIVTFDIAEDIVLPLPCSQFKEKWSAIKYPVHWCIKLCQVFVFKSHHYWRAPNLIWKLEVGWFGSHPVGWFGSLCFPYIGTSCAQFDLYYGAGCSCTISLLRTRKNIKVDLYPITEQLYDFLAPNQTHIIKKVVPSLHQLLTFMN